MVDTGDIFPSRQVMDEIPNLIAEVAEHLMRPEEHERASGPAVRDESAGPGHRHFREPTNVHRVLREYEVLGDVVAEALLAVIAEAEPPIESGDAVRIMRRVTHTVRLLQRQAVDACVARYTDQIDRQNAQLQTFSRLVAVEIRQPLSVLQVMSRLLPLPMGDMEAVRFADVFDRNVRRLVEVAARLERLSGNGEQTTTMQSAQRSKVNVDR